LQFILLVKQFLSIIGHRSTQDVCFIIIVVSESQDQLSSLLKNELTSLTHFGAGHGMVHASESDGKLKGVGCV
jgi:hypothetical protein